MHRVFFSQVLKLQTQVETQNKLYVEIIKHQPPSVLKCGSLCLRLIWLKITNRHFASYPLVSQVN